eukprot:UN20607
MNLVTKEYLTGINKGISSAILWMACCQKK